MQRKRNLAKKRPTREKPLSLYGMSFDDAVTKLAKAKPTKKPRTKK